MAEQLTSTEILRLRMHALGLSTGGGPNDAVGTAPSPVDVARRMLAVQGQDWRSAQWALGVRAPESTVADVRAAFDDGSLVRSWPMRGTVHVLAAEDIWWMQQALNHRILPGAAKRRATLGIDDATLDRLVEASVAALSTGLAPTSGLTRDDLSTAWTDAGIEWQRPWRYHLIWWLCQNGLAVFGPTGANGEPLLVPADRWIRHARELSGDAALAEIAARYTAARGPVHERDLAWWTGLTVREARSALRLAEDAGRVMPVTARADKNSGSLATAPAAPPDSRMWVSPEALGAGIDALPQAPSWLLLPAFDEHLLGYTQRDAQLDPVNFERIVPGRNGMFLATVVGSGRVHGTWKRSAGRAPGITVSPFPGTRIIETDLQSLADRWSSFHHDASDSPDDTSIGATQIQVAPPPPRTES